MGPSLSCPPGRDSNSTTSNSLFSPQQNPEHHLESSSHREHPRGSSHTLPIMPSAHKHAHQHSTLAGVACAAGVSGDRLPWGTGCGRKEQGPHGRCGLRVFSPVTWSPTLD